MPALRTIGRLTCIGVWGVTHHPRVVLPLDDGPIANVAFLEGDRWLLTRTNAGTLRISDPGAAPFEPLAPLATLEKVRRSRPASAGDVYAWTVDGVVRWRNDVRSSRC